MPFAVCERPETSLHSFVLIIRHLDLSDQDEKKLCHSWAPNWRNDVISYRKSI